MRLLILLLLLASPVLAGPAEEALQRAESLIEQGLPAEALAPLREAAAAAPDDVAVQRKYMELMKAQGYGRDVLAEFAARIEERPNEALGHYLYGVASGDPKTAKREFDRALEIDPHHKWARQGLGSVAIAEGRLDDALREYEAALVLDSGFAEVHNKLANLHVARGDSEQAKVAWKRAMEASPDDYHAWMNMGAVLSMEGDLPGAAELLRGAVQRAPGHARAHFNYGYVLFKLDQHDDALAHFAAALAINPRDRTVRGTQHLVQAVRDGDVPKTVIEPYEVAVASLLTDPPTSAQKYKEVLLLAPDFAFAHMNLGVAQAALGEVVAAQASLEKATELAPRDPDTHRNLGMFFLMLQKVGDAVPPLKAAHELDPSDSSLLAALANAQLGSGDLKGATASYRRALKLRPRDPELYVELAAAQAAAGYLDAAAESARGALKIAPELVPARVQLVAILREARRFDEALAQIAVLEEAIPGHPDIASERAAIEARSKAHQAQKAGGEIRVARIIVSDGSAAADLAQKARGGVDFGSLARQHSEGREAPRGGDIGYVDPTDLRPELAAALKGMGVGDVSNPVDLGGVFLILKRTE